MSNPLEYVPMSGPLPGERWEPSSGTCGAAFIMDWCANCARDLEMNGTCRRENRDAVDGDWCQILGASYRGEAVEWREMPDGEVKCLAFVPVGEPIPAICLRAPLEAATKTYASCTTAQQAYETLASIALDTFNADVSSRKQAGRL